MYRKKIESYRVKLAFDEIDRGSRFAFLRGDIVEVDEVGDDPEEYPYMGVQDLVIHGTDIYLDWKDYEPTDEMPTVGVVSIGRSGNIQENNFWVLETEHIPSL